MAALSFYSNFCSDPLFFSPDFSPELFYLTPTLPQLLPDPAFDYFPTAVDNTVFFPPLLDDDASSSFFFSDVYPYFSAPAIADCFVPVSTEFFPSDEFELHCPKRQRIVSEQNFGYGGSGGGGGGGYFPPLPELLPVPWDDKMNNAETMNAGTCLKSKQSPSNTLSAQTIAARERRRKITAKTQELGELIPGGNKMNTAEMLHSAFKYVKFLQAQVGILQLMQETEQVKEEKEEEEETEELQILESAMVQEKLYAEEKCLVPKGFVQNLANFPEIQSHPSIFNSINQMLHMQ
ncbi:transcription factor bHLH53-like [Momordica charantia]|uniref:Transcription factor bHLH53-like n=1 Tax=Momordica charantia TaxID=3673 RepID=A0A6J1CNN4_MOMCH|nr:transcription factor bHLH53-like [Momordica charantia]